MDAYENQVAAQVNHPSVDADQGIDVAADEYRDGGGGQRVLQQDGGAGQVAAPRAERPAGEAVAATGGGQRGGELRQGQHHAQIHRAHDQGGDQHAAEAPLGEP